MLMRGFCFFLLIANCLCAETVTVIGIGRLGLCFALCLEQAGYEVLGVDLSPEYVRQINERTLFSPEPGVNEALKKSAHFRATASLHEGLAFSDLYFIVVPTNPRATAGTYDNRAMDSLLSAIGEAGVENKHIVIMSTISPGYIRGAAIPQLQNCPGTTISYNPLFIQQGNIIHNMEYPDLVLIGESSVENGNELEAIYRKICSNEPYFARMSPNSAEIMKVALNCFVTMKISYANLIGDIAKETPGANAEAILKAVGMDSRIGSKCLQPGYGFGGPCFPRDNRALGDYAERLGLDSQLFRASDATNQFHADFLAKEFSQLNLEKYCFEDVCYKPNCAVPIIEESHKLLVAAKLARDGKIVTIKDRAEVIEQVQAEFGNLFEYIITR